MRASEYRNRVTLQASANSTADTYGGVSKVWSNVATGIRANVRSIGATETAKGELVKGEATVLVTTRYRSDVTQVSRFVFGSRNLYVQEVLPDTRNREIICTCREVLV